MSRDACNDILTSESKRTIPVLRRVFGSLSRPSARLVWFSPDRITLPCSLIASWWGDSVSSFYDRRLKRKTSSETLPNHSSSSEQAERQMRHFCWFFSSPKFFNMWRPGGAMWYSLPSSPLRLRLSVSSIRPRGQEENVRPPWRRPGFIFFLSRKRGQPSGVGDRLHPGAPGCLWHGVGEGASAGSPPCHWLLAEPSGESGAAAVWQL